LLHVTVEGPVADDRASAFPAFLLWLAGGVTWEVVSAGRSEVGAAPGRGPPPAAWRCVVVETLPLLQAPTRTVIECSLTMQVVKYSHITEIMWIGPRRCTAFDNDKVTKDVTVPWIGELYREPRLLVMIWNFTVSCSIQFKNMFRSRTVKYSSLVQIHHPIHHNVILLLYLLNIFVV
jgi:hypothetical protein